MIDAGFPGDCWRADAAEEIQRRREEAGFSYFAFGPPSDKTLDKSCPFRPKAPFQCSRSVGPHPRRKPEASCGGLTLGPSRSGGEQSEDACLLDCLMTTVYA